MYFVQDHPSHIDSCHVCCQMVLWFQKGIKKKNPIGFKVKTVLGGSLASWLSIKDHPNYIPAKFAINWFSGFRQKKYKNISSIGLMLILSYVSANLGFLINTKKLKNCKRSSYDYSCIDWIQSNVQFLKEKKKFFSILPQGPMLLHFCTQLFVL